MSSSYPTVGSTFSLMNYSKAHSITKRALAIKFCFKDDSNCSGNIISSHSIQNNRFLRQISRDGKVYTMDVGCYNDVIVECGRKEESNNFLWFLRAS